STSTSAPSPRSGCAKSCASRTVRPSWSAWAAPTVSRCSGWVLRRAPRRGNSTSPSRPPTAPPWTRCTRRRWQPGSKCCTPPVSSRSTTPATTECSCATWTATTSRPSTTARSSRLGRHGLAHRGPRLPVPGPHPGRGPPGPHPHGVPVRPPSRPGRGRIRRRRRRRSGGGRIRRGRIRMPLAVVPFAPLPVPPHVQRLQRRGQQRRLGLGRLGQEGGLELGAQPVHVGENLAAQLPPLRPSGRVGGEQVGELVLLPLGLFEVVFERLGDRLGR